MPSRLPSSYQFALRHSVSVIGAQPASTAAANTQALVDRLTQTLLLLVVSMDPSFTVARAIRLHRMPAALYCVELILRLQAENRVAERHIVPIRAAAFRCIHAGTAAERQENEGQRELESHAGANRPRPGGIPSAAYCGFARPVSMPAARA